MSNRDISWIDSFIDSYHSVRNEPIQFNHESDRVEITTNLTSGTRNELDKFDGWDVSVEVLVPRMEPSGTIIRGTYIVTLICSHNLRYIFSDENGMVTLCKSKTEELDVRAKALFSDSKDHPLSCGVTRLAYECRNGWICMAYVYDSKHYAPHRIYEDMYQWIEKLFPNAPKLKKVCDQEEDNV